MLNCHFAATIKLYFSPSCSCSVCLTHFNSLFRSRVLAISVLILKANAPGGEQTSKFWQGCSSYFLGLKSGQILFFWVGKCFSYFSGFCKISAIFLGLTNFQLLFGSSNFCVTRLNPLHEEHTILKNKIIVAFHIYSNFDKHCIMSHSIFLGLNFGAFYFLGVWI